MKKLVAMVIAMTTLYVTMTGFACPYREKEECVFGEWEYAEYATPSKAGERFKVCADCKNRVFEAYTVEMEDNSIYIPGTEVLGCFAKSSYTQKAIDGNDMVYTEYAYRVKDENNPFILGHWYGSLSTLHQTRIGQKIYICTNGKIETYEVVVSEYAVEDQNCVQIIGQTTGANIWDTLGNDVSSPYASYGLAHGSKNLLEKVNDGKTLHIYTCYNDRGDPWKKEDGQRGRWIVLAALVNTAEAPSAEYAAME